MKEIVDGYGEVMGEYGGYAIRIIDEERFPWTKVCCLLLSVNHEVWIEKRGENMFVMSKPLAD